jgi:hypothetical protein
MLRGINEMPQYCSIFVLAARIHKANKMSCSVDVFSALQNAFACSTVIGPFT